MTDQQAVAIRSCASRWRVATQKHVSGPTILRLDIPKFLINSGADFKIRSFPLHILTQVRCFRQRRGVLSTIAAAMSDSASCSIPDYAR